jgi:hypothetical protein
MTSIFLFVSLILNSQSTAAAKPAACSFFTTANAARILGANVKAEDTEYKEADQNQKWGCKFTVDGATGDKSPILHFGLWRSKTEAIATEEFAAVKASNEKLAGFEMWSGVGDEASVHTDGSNFQFILVRKGANSIRIKVNPTTNVDINVVKDVAKSLVSKLK